MRCVHHHHHRHLSSSSITDLHSLSASYVGIIPACIDARVCCSCDTGASLSSHSTVICNHYVPRYWSQPINTQYCNVHTRLLRATLRSVCVCVFVGVHMRVSDCSCLWKARWPGIHPYKVHTKIQRWGRLRYNHLCSLSGLTASSTGNCRLESKVSLRSR